MRLGKFFLERDRAYDKARAHFEAISAEDNRDEDQRAESTLKIGVCFYQARNFGKCFGVMRDVIEHFPVSKQVNQAYYYIGLGHFQLGHYSRAIAALEKVGTNMSGEDDQVSKVEAGKRFFVRIDDADLAALEPGKPVKVTVTVTSGDSETVECFTVGRNVRIALGSIPTRLGRPQKGNGRLEVKGDDTVTVTYTDSHTADKKTDQPVLNTVTVVGDGVAAITDGAFEETLQGAVLGKAINLQISDPDRDLTDGADSIVAVVEVYRRKTDEEIEAELLAQPEIREAVVVAQEGPNGARLVAYVVPQADSELDTSKLHDRLGQQLPDYMVPGVVIMLDTLPLNANGKVERKALPEPHPGEPRDYVTPSTPEAHQLAEIWQQVLGIERVGETDNFFELGGDSLLSLKVMNHVQALREPKLDFKLFDLMQKPTIADLLEVRNHTEVLPKGALMLNGECRTQPPLFCIHAVMGTVFDYQPLARRLQGVCTVYGLSCRMLTDPQHRDSSLETMADDYVETIRRIQPVGPYRLLGWSLGGALAAMIAARLEGVGQDVSQLALIDPYVPGGGLHSEDSWQRDFANFASVILPSVSLEARDGKEESKEEPSEEEVALKLSKLMASFDAYGREGYATLGSEELARIFCVARHLKYLSLQLDALPALDCDVDCWWESKRGWEERQALANQLNRIPRTSIETPHDHFSIVGDEDLISQVEELLEASAHRYIGEQVPA